MGSWYINKIIIDSREKTRGRNAYNYYIDTYDIEVKSLKYGDYLFYTNDGKQVIFEFKNCKDFIKSMEDKSLFNELANQTYNYAYSYIILCGDFDETFKYLYFNVPHYRYKYKTLQVLKNRLTAQINGALDRIYAMYIPVISVENEEKAFEQMLKISSKIADNKKYGGIVRPSTDKLMENPCAIFLTSVSGIGETKADNIINELGVECLDDLCNQDSSNFLSVKKITKKNVCELWKKIHNEELKL